MEHVAALKHVWEWFKAVFGNLGVFWHWYYVGKTTVADMSTNGNAKYCLTIEAESGPPVDIVTDKQHLPT